MNNAKMRTCYTEPCGAHQIAIADLAQPGELHNGWTITRINVPINYRDQRLGSKLLRRICDDADQSRSTLYLEISPSGRLNYEELKAWYERYGFKLQASTGYYKRSPKKEQP